MNYLEQHVRGVIMKSYKTLLHNIFGSDTDRNAFSDKPMGKAILKINDWVGGSH